MNIIQALKEKNKLVKKTLELQNRITTYNCVIEGNPRAYDPKDELVELDKTIEELIKIKTKISRANKSVQEKIYRLSELKTKINFLKVIPTTEGKAPSGKGYYAQSEMHVWVSSIKAKERDKHILELEKEIDIIQKELDDHNYNTTI
ncbi:DIP1984 family protein [Flagellimonas sp. 2504JD4-2]